MRNTLPTASRFSKRADLGGDGQDRDFERAFAELARGLVEQTAPLLAEHDVGFEVVERDDSDDRAFAVIGYQLGDALALTPVLWMRGKLRGGECLVLVASNMAVPLKDGWVRRLLRQGNMAMGKETSMSLSDLRVRGQYQTSRSNHSYKQARAKIEQRARLKAAGAALFRSVQDSGWLRLLKFRGEATLRGLHKMAKEQPLLIDQLGEWFGGEFHSALKDMTADVLKDLGDNKGKALVEISLSATIPMPKTKKTAAAKPPEQRPVDGVRVFSERRWRSGAAVPSWMTDADKESLLKCGVAIQDNRNKEAKTKAVSRDLLPSQLQNPGTDGLYDLLTDKGVRTCWVFRKGRETHRSCHDRETYAGVSLHHIRHQEPNHDGPKEVEVIAVDGGMRTVLPITHVWGLPSNKSPKDLGLSPAKDGLPPLSYIVNGSQHERVELSVEDDDRDTPVVATDEAGRLLYRELYGNGRYIVDDKAGTGIRHLANTCHIPSDALVVPIDYSKDALSLLSLQDIRMTDSDSTTELVKDYEEIRIKHAGIWSDRLSTGEAVGQLVAWHGVSTEDARRMVDQPGVYRLIKTAAPHRYEPIGDVWEPEEGQLSLMYGDSIRQLESDERRVPMETPERDGYDDEIDLARNGRRGASSRSSSRDPRVDRQTYVARLQQQSQPGQKGESLPTGALRALLRTVDVDARLDRAVPPLMAAMSECCLLLLLTYWQGDDFIARFGDGDLPEMEDALRNLAESLGDMVLKLEESLPGTSDVTHSLRTTAAAS